MKRSFIYPLNTVLVVFIIFIINFYANGWISGWDNLHPEFNFALNIKRSIFAVWQEYQGLGLLGGMGHASDLPRQILLYLSSVIFPLHLLRQLYIFLMLLLGPLGVYFLLNKIIKQKAASLLGAVFYLLNLATVQTFYTSFEPFITHFGFLPWLFLVAFNYIERSSLKNMILFIVVNILAIPQAYVPTVFLVYFLALSGSLMISSIKKAPKILLLTILINAFWLLPFLYFTLTNSAVTIEAKINQMTTENVYLLNKNFGNIGDVAILKGFWFNYRDFSHNDHKFDDLMLPWKNHLDKPFIRGIGFLLFAIVLSGIIIAFKQKNQYRWVVLFLFLVSFVILANNTPPFSWIDLLLYRLPLVSQALRSPFTKFSILAALTYSIFFAVAIGLFFNYMRKSINKIVLFMSIVALIVLFTLPIFQGHLFYRQIKVNIPQNYLQLWKFFDSQDPNSRIAHFPIPTFWGWDFYSWDYSGSGFLWYGLKQPILDRAFDVWSSADENYYWEISFALYSKNLAFFEKVLEKYQVSWLLIDENVLYPPSPKALFFDELEQLISSSNKITLFQNLGKIKIYQFNLDPAITNFVFLAEDLPTVRPTYKWNNFDQAYLDNGSYTSENSNSLYYPFRTLFSGKTQKDLEFSVEDKGNYFIISNNLPSLKWSSYYLNIPKIEDEDLQWVNPDKLSEVKTLLEDVYFDGKKVEVIVPKTGGLYSAEITPGNKRDFPLPNLPHNFSYLITVKSSNLTGRPLNFWFENSNLRKADLETNLPKTESTTYFFIQPPMEKDGLGYTLHFDEEKNGDSSKNEIRQIEINPLPFNFLTGLVLRKGQLEKTSSLVSVQVEHPNTSSYLVKKIPAVSTLSLNSTLVLSQAYDQGWKAYIINDSLIQRSFPFIFGQEIKDHVLVNNWENGWKLNNQYLKNNSQIVIVYLPQYLELVGMLCGLFFIAFVIVTKILARPP